MNAKVMMGVRVLAALFMLIFGLNKFLNFLPMPPIEGDGGQLMGIYFTSGFMKIIGVLEILTGLLLLANKYVGLAIILFAAIMFNAFVFHALHDMKGIGGAVLGVILSILLYWGNRGKFTEVFRA